MEHLEIAYDLLVILIGGFDRVLPWIDRGESCLRCLIHEGNIPAQAW